MNNELNKDAKAEPNLKQERRFAYFGRLEKKMVNSKKEEYIQHTHSGVICVGYDYVEDGQVVVGVAFCSPEDAFSKKKARLIINQRIAAGISAPLPVPAMKPFSAMNYEELVKEIQTFIQESALVNGDIITDDDLPKIAGVRAPRWLV